MRARINMRLRCAGMEVLSDIETSFDLVFLDANKKQYENYLRKMLDLGTIRVGGLLVVDNVLWKGRVLQLQDLSEEVRQCIRVRLFAHRSVSHW